VSIWGKAALAVGSCVAIGGVLIVTGVVPLARLIGPKNTLPPCSSLPTMSAARTQLTARQDLVTKYEAIGADVKVTLITPCDDKNIGLAQITYGSESQRAAIEDLLRTSMPPLGLPVQLVEK
jgi:hypothetical protein